MIPKSWAEKPYPHPTPCSSSQTGKNSETGSSLWCNFKQLWVSWQKSCPPHQAAKQGKSWDWIYSFHAISSNFGSAGRKGPCQQAEKPPPPAAKQGKILRLDLSISYNLQQLWFSLRKAPTPNPHPSSQTGKNSETGSIHFMKFPATLVRKRTSTRNERLLARYVNPSSSEFIYRRIKFFYSENCTITELI